MLIMIDNYDSFTYNLVQEIGRFGEEIKVWHNDEITADEILSEEPDGIIISPGPCTPNEAGISIELVQKVFEQARLGRIIPILGVCLGHQVLAAAFEGKVVRAPEIVHGKTTRIAHTGQGLFRAMEQRFRAARYHSLIVEENSLNPEWQVTARSENGLIMGIEHSEFPLYGLQFHPESILTANGAKILQEFINIVHEVKQFGKKSSRVTKSLAEKGEPSMSEISLALNELASGRDLSLKLAQGVMEELLSGELAPAQIGALLLGLRMKGESAEEIAAFASVLREYSNTIPAPEGTVDTCGTGGDGSGTFNISTTSAFVVAGAGVPVAKHGNRFASGRCGSADVLEQLRVPINLTPEANTLNLQDIGMAFLFAPLYHPALGKVATHRRELGVRTIFNLLGPLLNPAQAPYQLLGVSTPEIQAKMAKAITLLGVKRAIVVVGEDGLDEVTLTGKTHAILIDNGKMTEFDIDPEEFGFKLCTLEDLKGAGPIENARFTLGILQGEKGPKRDIVLLNAGVALFAAQKAADIGEGIELAKESLDSGCALAKLEALKQGGLQAVAL